MGQHARTVPDFVAVHPEHIALARFHLAYGGKAAMLFDTHPDLPCVWRISGRNVRPIVGQPLLAGELECTSGYQVHLAVGEHPAHHLGHGDREHIEQLQRNRPRRWRERLDEHFRRSDRRPDLGIACAERNDEVRRICLENERAQQLGTSSEERVAKLGDVRVACKRSAHGFGSRQDSTLVALHRQRMPPPPHQRARRSEFHAWHLLWHLLWRCCGTCYRRALS